MAPTKFSFFTVYFLLFLKVYLSYLKLVSLPLSHLVM